jgi:Lipopolysaccharide-assembly, LptC-related
LKYTLFATEATGITLNRAATMNLKIDVYDNGQKTTTITSPKADLYVSEQKMRTKNTVHIERADMDATSQECDFDVKAKVFRLRTHVKVLLKHFDVGAGTSGTATTAKSAGPATLDPLPANNAAAGLVPDTSRPAPIDDSILPSPGAYSDTNAAPLPPSNPATK